MIHFKCPSCGAPLDARLAGEPIVCRFCRTSLVVPQVTPQGRTGTPKASRINAMVTVWLVAIMLLVAASALFIGLFVQSGPTAIAVAPTPVAARGEPVAAPPPPVDRGIAPSALASLTADRGWVKVDATDRISDWSRVDVQRDLPALRDLARLWADDAVLDVIFVTGVRPDGTLDLRERDDFDLDVRFLSPGLQASAEALREVSERKVETRFRLGLQEGEIHAMASFTTGNRGTEVPPPLTLGCDQATAMQRWLDEHAAPRRPLYRMHLQPIGSRGRPGWRWMLRDFESGGSFEAPIFDPSTCDKQR